MERGQLSSGGEEVFDVLTPGTPVLIQFAGDRQLHKTAYVGMARGETVIVRLPLTPGVTRWLEGAPTLVVRFVHEGRAYGFEANLQLTQRKPVPLLFLSFPKAVHQMGLRSCERLTVLEQAVLRIEGKTYSALMTDVSCGGCRLRLSRTPEALALPEGAAGTVTFGLSLENHTEITLKCELLHVDAQGRMVKCRLSFLKDQDLELARLGAFLQDVSRLLRE